MPATGRPGDGGGSGRANADDNHAIIAMLMADEPEAAGTVTLAPPEQPHDSTACAGPGRACRAPARTGSHRRVPRDRAGPADSGFAGPDRTRPVLRFFWAGPDPLDSPVLRLRRAWAVGAMVMSRGDGPGGRPGKSSAPRAAGPPSQGRLGRAAYAGPCSGPGQSARCPMPVRACALRSHAAGPARGPPAQRWRHGAGKEGGLRAVLEPDPGRAIEDP